MIKNEDDRYEIKFILNENELVEAYYFINMIGAFKSYQDRRVNSLYFDTVDYQGIRENLAGISNRFKLRLRWYGEINDKYNNKFILEKKIRNGRLGSKEKFFIPELSKYNIYSMNTREISKNVFDSINKYHKGEDILNDIFLPMLLVNYEREYYECNNELRITIDKNITFRDISLYSPVIYYAPLSYNEYIMEFKFPIDKKDIVSDLIRTLNLTPKRHSKYITGMAKLGYCTYI